MANNSQVSKLTDKLLSAMETEATRARLKAQRLLKAISAPSLGKPLAGSSNSARNVEVRRSRPNS